MNSPIFLPRTVFVTLQQTAHAYAKSVFVFPVHQVKNTDLAAELKHGLFFIRIEKQRDRRPSKRARAGEKATLRDMLKILPIVGLWSCKEIRWSADSSSLVRFSTRLGLVQP